MQLVNDFVIPLDVDQAWSLLTDVEKLAPCMPGAFLTSVEGGQYSGGVKIKIGPITAAYTGVAEFVELDLTTHRAILRAEAREASGSGNASADVVMQLTSSGADTEVLVTTELAISGRLAQFGRGIIADISSRLIGQFVSALERDVLSRGDGNEPAAAVALADRPLEPRFANVEIGPNLSQGRRDVASEVWPDSEPVSTPTSHTRPVPVKAFPDEQPLDAVAALVLPSLRRVAAPIGVGILGCLLIVGWARMRRKAGG